MAVKKKNNAEEQLNENKTQKKKYYKKPIKGTKSAKGSGKNDSKKSAQKQADKTKSANKKPKQNKKTAKPANKRSYTKKAPKSVKPLRITPLGGLGEIGKNITLYEYGEEMLLVDCGMSFPDEEMPGIDIVIPDFGHIVKNVEKIKGLFVTHGHEDHIGAIPYLLKECNIPVYGTALTLGLIEGKLREHKILDRAALNVIKPRDTVKLGAFSVEFIHVNHSIPDAVALAITTPAGTVVQTGDFKIDTTPIDGEVIDLARLGELGKKGVLALLSDSTNAERPGFTPSESIVGESFSTLFKKAENKRIIVATFSSNIHRVQQIVDEAVRCGRKVAVSGRSMLNVVQVASELGYLNIPDGVLIDLEMVKKYLPEQVVIITTGSQGEPMSALHRMAFGDHRNVFVGPGDFIIISATPIPGNEKTVTKVINKLLELGAHVVYEKMYDVHVSGHACQEELKLMLNLVRPRFFIPVHGEQKHLVKHAGLAETVGIEHKNILIGKNGNVIELTAESMKVVETVTAGSILVDGFGVGDVGNVVLRDRKHLSEDGIIVVAVSVDQVTREVIAGPEVISRGFVYVKEAEKLMEDAREVACDILERCYITNVRDWNTVKSRIRDGLARHLHEQTGRSPMILPVILEI
ncbi:MAG: RNase J family beta-CASP ribonuclease [Clostridia bacterium]|nr:RNase J family beta-CASP ribonuclease [Clostridia bacterium]